MPSHLVVSALGKDRPGIVEEISKAILDAGGNLEESRMTVLGGEFALMALVSGSDDCMARLQTGLPALGEARDLTILLRPTQTRVDVAALLPYRAEVVCMDHPGIVHDVAAFFATRGINIHEMNTTTYAAPHTGTPMFSLDMTVSLPTTTNVGRLRQEFTAFCDGLNLDATLEAEGR